ncbi:NAD(P)-binding protein [Acephala macrosclerotiorum]|nr:NAD(P)-binding protein [Acephala macrosclerotiorum]
MTRGSLSAKWNKATNTLQRFQPYLQIRTSAVQCRAAYSTSRISTRITNQNRGFTTTATSPPPVAEEHTEDAASKKPIWEAPRDVENRPVTIIGAGVLGRRLAVIWASTGRPVNLYDEDPLAFETATPYIADTLSLYCSNYGTHPGHVHFSSSLLEAVSNSWLIIECVPEDIELKISVLGRLDRLAPADAIIATNSSSFASRELVSEVKRRERVLNTLYYVPPANKCVELMSCGYTSPSLVSFLTAQMREVGLMPFVVGRESTGMIFPRLWAALKRETLLILKDSVAKPEEIDELFRDFFGAAKGPCEKMDEIGLDTIAAVERKFLDEKEKRNETELWRGRGHLRWLEEEFVERGRLGEKTGEGLVCHKSEEERNRRGHRDGEVVWNEHAVDLSGM